MSDKPWKRMERQCAADLEGGERNPITGRTRDEGLPDVQSEQERLAVECKYRSSPFPKVYTDAIDEARKTAAKAGDAYAGVVRWHVKGQRRDTDIVFMDWETFERIKGWGWS